MSCFIRNILLFAVFVMLAVFMLWGFLTEIWSTKLKHVSSIHSVVNFNELPLCVTLH
jgi:hypothetical protein